MNELVSIVMPAYNGASYIGKSIRSVQAQSYENWELLIVDDCSTDHTGEVIKSFQDPRIRYLRNEKNSGAAISRNYALREAKGRWIAFLDSDDLWDPDKLESQIAFMKEHGYKFTYTDYRIVNPDGTPGKYYFVAPDRMDKNAIWRYCSFSIITVIYDREAVGLLQSPDLKKRNDYALWLKMPDSIICYRYPKCLSSYCRRENSVSNVRKYLLIKHQYILYRKGMELAVIPSLYCTVRNIIRASMKKIFYRRKV